MTTIPLAQIKPSPRPVRSSWDEEAMEELAQSIREQGVIAPIKVRPVGKASLLHFPGRFLLASAADDQDMPF